MSSSKQDTRSAPLNYLNAATQSSLYRNGEVLTRRDKDGSDGGTEGVNTKLYTKLVCSARGLSGADKKTCEANGFELLHAPLDDVGLDFFNHDSVVRDYYRQCEQLVAEATGAKAFAFDHNIRSALGKNSKQRIAGGQLVQGPAKMVHGDYTLHSAPQRLRDLGSPPAVNDTLRTVLPPGEALLSDELVQRAVGERDGRFAIINVWRSIAEAPVQTNPMALCDGRSVVPDDLVTFEIHYHDRIGENYFAKHNDDHRFYFFPEMTRDEPMLLKQWDSAGTMARTDGAQADGSQDGPCTFSFHSAFDDPTVGDDAPERLSIEVRCVVVY